MLKAVSQLLLTISLLTNWVS